MHSNRLALGVTVVTLSAAMLVWFHLFAFSKVVYLPAWASLLPLPPFVGDVVAMPFLMPVAFLSLSVRAPCKGTVWAAALSPVTALVVYALTPLHQHSGLPLNLLVQYILLAVLGCLLPGSLLLGLRAVSRFVGDRLTTQSRRDAA